jgi:hypothetical protein
MSGFGSQLRFRTRPVLSPLWPAKGPGVPYRTAWGAASGGAEGVRTPDPRLAKPMLSQLSYSPVCAFGELVGLDRVELSTSRLSGVRSNHLSYRPG